MARSFDLIPAMRPRDRSFLADISRDSEVTRERCGFCSTASADILASSEFRDVCFEALHRGSSDSAGAHGDND